MPHTNRKKKTAVDAPARKPTVIHTKRQQLEDDEGWTHIVDKPQTKKFTPKAVSKLLQGGDFEVNGVSYVNRTLEEMREDHEHWQRSWEDRPTCKDLKAKLKDVEKERKIENVVVLGLGSLQSARREGRRTSSTQLAALQSIVGVLEKGSELQVVFQDPQFTELDKEFLTGLGYKVVEDPEAFAQIGEGSLVYAIHCYASVYKAVSERPRPAVFIGTDVENFGRFDTSEDTTAKDLENMVEGYDKVDFPQLRHDFSDTKVYTKSSTKELPSTEEAKISPLLDTKASTEELPSTQEHKTSAPPDTTTAPN